MSKKITYEDKKAIQNDEDVLEVNKVTDENVNEIKKVVNDNADELDDIKKQVESFEEKEKGDKGDPGNGIEHIILKDGNHTPGEFDTYEIKFTDGRTTEFKVYNGKDGKSLSTGDMSKSVYDTDDDGIVEEADHAKTADTSNNALKVNNHNVEKDVPENAEFTDTTYENASEEIDGLMSKEDKKKLNNLYDYSEEERIVGKWIDGRDVYKKTIEFTFSSTTLNWNKITTGLNIDFLIDTPSGSFMPTNKLQCYPLPYARYSGSIETITFWVFEGDLHENHNFEYPNGFLGYVTIKYVKKGE